MLRHKLDLPRHKTDPFDEVSIVFRKECASCFSKSMPLFRSKQWKEAAHHLEKVFEHEGSHHFLEVPSSFVDKCRTILIECYKNMEEDRNGLKQSIALAMGKSRSLKNGMKEEEKEELSALPWDGSCHSWSLVLYFAKKTKNYDWMCEALQRLSHVSPTFLMEYARSLFILNRRDECLNVCRKASLTSSMRRIDRKNLHDLLEFLENEVKKQEETLEFSHSPFISGLLSAREEYTWSILSHDDHGDGVDGAHDVCSGDDGDAARHDVHEFCLKPPPLPSSSSSLSLRNAGSEWSKLFEDILKTFEKVNAKTNDACSMDEFLLSISFSLLSSDSVKPTESQSRRTSFSPLDDYSIQSDCTDSQARESDSKDGDGTTKRRRSSRVQLKHEALEKMVEVSQSEQEHSAETGFDSVGWINATIREFSQIFKVTGEHQSNTEDTTIDRDGGNDGANDDKGDEIMMEDGDDDDDDYDGDGDDDDGRHDEVGRKMQKKRHQKRADMDVDMDNDIDFDAHNILSDIAICWKRQRSLLKELCDERRVLTLHEFLCFITKSFATDDFLEHHNYYASSVLSAFVRLLTISWKEAPFARWENREHVFLAEAMYNHNQGDACASFEAYRALGTLHCALDDFDDEEDKLSNPSEFLARCRTDDTDDEMYTTNELKMRILWVLCDYFFHHGDLDMSSKCLSAFNARSLIFQTEIGPKRMWINHGTFLSAKDRIEKQAHLLDSLEHLGSRNEMTGKLTTLDIESSLIDMLVKYCDHSSSLVKQNAQILAQKVFRMRREDLGDRFDSSIANVSSVLKSLGAKLFPEMHMNMLNVAISKCLKKEYWSFLCICFAMILPDCNIEDPQLFATAMNCVSTCLGHIVGEDQKNMDTKTKRMMESFGSTLVIWMDTFSRSFLNLGKSHPKKKEQIDRRALGLLSPVVQSLLQLTQYLSMVDDSLWERRFTNICSLCFDALLYDLNESKQRKALLAAKSTANNLSSSSSLSSSKTRKQDMGEEEKGVELRDDETFVEWMFRTMDAKRSHLLSLGLTLLQSIVNMRRKTLSGGVRDCLIVLGMTIFDLPIEFCFSDNDPDFMKEVDDEEIIEIIDGDDTNTPKAMQDGEDFAEADFEEVDSFFSGINRDLMSLRGMWSLEPPFHTPPFATAFGAVFFPRVERILLDKHAAMMNIASSQDVLARLVFGAKYDTKSLSKPAEANREILQTILDGSSNFWESRSSLTSCENDETDGLHAMFLLARMNMKLSNAIMDSPMAEHEHEDAVTVLQDAIVVLHRCLCVEPMASESWLLRGVCQHNLLRFRMLYGLEEVSGKSDAYGLKMSPANVLHLMQRECYRCYSTCLECLGRERSRFFWGHVDTSIECATQSSVVELSSVSEGETIPLSMILQLIVEHILQLQRPVFMENLHYVESFPTIEDILREEREPDSIVFQHDSPPLCDHLERSLMREWHPDVEGSEKHGEVLYRYATVAMKIVEAMEDDETDDEGARPSDPSHVPPSSPSIPPSIFQCPELERERLCHTDLAILKTKILHILYPDTWKDCLAILHDRQHHSSFEIGHSLHSLRLSLFKEPPLLVDEDTLLDTLEEFSCMDNENFANASRRVQFWTKDANHFVDEVFHADRFPPDQPRKELLLKNIAMGLCCSLPRETKNPVHVEIQIADILQLLSRDEEAQRIRWKLFHKWQLLLHCDSSRPNVFSKRLLLEEFLRSFVKCTLYADEDVQDARQSVRQCVDGLRHMPAAVRDGFYCLGLRHSLRHVRDVLEEEIERDGDSQTSIAHAQAMMTSSVWIRNVVTQSYKFLSCYYHSHMISHNASTSQQDIRGLAVELLQTIQMHKRMQTQHDSQQDIMETENCWDHSLKRFAKRPRKQRKRID